MKRKRKLLAILMAVAMAWQGVSFANADELTSSASASTVPTATEAGSQGSPSEEDIKAEQAKQEAEKQAQAAAAALNATTGKAVSVNAKANYVNKDNSAAYNNEALDNYGQFGVAVDFTVPNGQSPKAGDTTVFQLSDSLKILKSDNFQIKDGDQVVANAVINAEAKTVTLTYTDYVEKKSDIKGNFWLSMQVNSDKEKDAKQLSTALKVNNTTEIAIDGTIN